MSSKVLLASAGAVAAAVIFLFARPRHAPVGEGVAGVAPEEASDLIARASRNEAMVPATPAIPREALPIVAASAEGIVLEGRVLTAAAGADPARAKAAPNVIVQARRGGLLALGQEETPSEAKTAADGAFRLLFRDPGPRPLELEVGVDPDADFGSVWETVRIEAGETRRAGLVLVRRVLGDLTGHTRDPAGAPVPGVEISLLDWDEAGNTQVPMARAVSDSVGAFRFEHARPFEALAIAKSGYTLLEGKKPGISDDGIWETLELVLCGGAALRVQVEDPLGQPVPGVVVGVAVAAPERVHVKAWENSLREARWVETDAAGAALVTDLWAGQRLIVHVQREQVQLLSFERVKGEGPVLDEAGPGAPLVLAPGDVRALHVRLPTRFRIFGRVLEADGSPFPEPHVTVRSLDVPPYHEDSIQQATIGDAQGNYELDLLAARPLGRVLVTAKDVPEPTMSFYGADRGAKTSPRAAWVELDLGGRASGAEERTLVLAPTLAVAGHLIAEGAADLQATVRARALADPLPYDQSVSGLQPAVHTRKGAFRIAGLAPGRYDLEITPAKHFATTWVRGVEAGTEDLEVRLVAGRSARVRVEVVLLGGELEQTILLTGRLRPHGAAPAAPELPASSVCRAPEGWPPSMVSLWSGGGGHTDETGATRFSLLPMQTNPTTVELDEGLWWIGAQAKTEHGTLAFPIGTGLVNVGPGDHDLRIELTPCGSIEGYVRCLSPESDLRIALAHDGRLLALDVGREALASIADLGADGFFRFPKVPAGAVELRVGTREELLAGVAQRVRSVELAAGETLSVTIDP